MGQNLFSNIKRSSFFTWRGSPSSSSSMRVDACNERWESFSRHKKSWNKIRILLNKKLKNIVRLAIFKWDKHNLTFSLFAYFDIIFISHRTKAVKNLWTRSCTGLVISNKSHFMSLKLIWLWLQESVKKHGNDWIFLTCQWVPWTTNLTWSYLT